MILNPDFWQDTANVIFENPGQLSSHKQGLQEAIQSQGLESHIFIRTSGTTLKTKDQEKWVALSRQAFLNSAHSVNQYFSLSEEDTWISVLPQFHVGGLAQYARAYRAGSKIITFEGWNAELYCKAIATYSGTVSSLVPTQVFDLVSRQLENPGLRIVFVGGGAIDPQLAQSAIDLGWPLVTTYGMTETCSQIAVKNLSIHQPMFLPLPHAQLKMEESGCLAVQCSSLMTGQFLFDGSSWQFVPQTSEWFVTEDLVRLSQSGFEILGRGSDVVKILGENVSLFQLESKISQQLAIPLHHLSVVAVPESRRGSHLILVIETQEVYQKDKFQLMNQKLVGFERIHGMLQLDQLPRTSLGKVVRSDLSKVVSQLQHHWILINDSNS